jgi:ProP effector
MVEPNTTATAIALLAETYPRCFAVYQARRRPLKIGIHKDILRELDGALTPDELSAALRYYTGNKHYLLALRPGAQRVDLDGEPAGAVTEDQAQAAAAALARRYESERQKQHAEPRPIPAIPMIPPAARRDGLAALRAAGRQRREAGR